jgi:hypothetical protein
MNLFLRIDAAALAYQMNVAEAPAAVTWKEFDEFLTQWRKKQIKETEDSWIEEQGKKVGRLYIEVYRESFDAALRRYAELLEKAENVMIESKRPAEFVRAKSLFALLKCLTSKLGRVGEQDKLLNEERFESLLKRFASFAGCTTTTAYQELRKKESVLLTTLVRGWGPDIGELIRVLQPFQSSLLRGIESQAAKELYRQVCAEAVPKFTKQVLERFREEDYTNRVIANRPECHGAINILLDVSGPLWKDDRGRALAFFRTESRNPVVRDNIFELLHWIDLILKDENRFNNLPMVKSLLKDEEIVNVLWSALTSTPLGPRPVSWLRDLPKRLEDLGTTVTLPDWWNRTLETLGLSGEVPLEDANPNSGTPQEEQAP